MTGAVLVPAGPRLRLAGLARLPIAAGRYLAADRLDPVFFSDYRMFEPLGIASAIYLITDSNRRIRWLGQANRNGDLVARLAEHARSREKTEVFTTLRVLHLIDRTPAEAIDSIEGRCADLLGLRGAMGPRRWPSSDAWQTLVP